MNRKFKVTYQDKALNKIEIDFYADDWTDALIKVFRGKKAEWKVLTLTLIVDDNLHERFESMFPSRGELINAETIMD